MALIPCTPKKIRPVIEIHILPDGRYRRIRADSADFAEMEVILTNASGDCVIPQFHQLNRHWIITINGELIAGNLTVTRRMPKSPRFAHIPVYVLRRP